MSTRHCLPSGDPGSPMGRLSRVLISGFAEIAFPSCVDV